MYGQVGGGDMNCIRLFIISILHSLCMVLFQKNSNRLTFGQ